MISKKLNLRTWLAAFATLFVLSGFALHQGKAQAVTLADLLQPNAEIISGDKKFFGFANYLQSGNLDVPASSIDVFPITSGGEFGLRFQRSAGWELSVPNQTYDMSLDFFVTRLDGLPLIMGNTLEITGNHVGGGEAHIIEGVIDDNTLATLANKEVYINLGNSGVDNLIDQQNFPQLAAVLRISKDFQLQTRDSQLENIFVSHFDQTFAQLPEPSSAVLAGMGIVGFLRLARRRRKAAR